MADLRDLFSEMGFTDVATYLQSGNVVFSSPETDPQLLTGRLESAMEKRYGFEIPTLLVEDGQLRAIAHGCPYVDAAAADPTRVHALFVHPTPDSLDLDPTEFLPEECALGEGVVYLHLPDGMHRSKLNTRVQQMVSEVKATARNWRTVVNLVEML